jgi:hypothetical protein
MEEVGLSTFLDEVLHPFSPKKKNRQAWSEAQNSDGILVSPNESIHYGKASHFNLMSRI